MNRSGLMVTSLIVAMLLTSGVGWAVTKNCRTGVNSCLGTSGSDTLNGSGKKDKIYGLEGKDRVWGRGGNDTLEGGRGGDKLKGGPGQEIIGSSTQGEDEISGGSGNDQIDDYSYHFENGTKTSDKNVLDGGFGDDWLYGHNRLHGGPGADYVIGSYAWGRSDRTLIGGRGKDNISSNGAADDTIYARDGVRDAIFCGGGYDTVYFDRGTDFINRSNCEKLIGQ